MVMTSLKEAVRYKILQGVIGGSIFQCMLWQIERWAGGMLQNNLFFNLCDQISQH